MEERLLPDGSPAGSNRPTWAQIRLPLLIGLAAAIGVLLGSSFTHEDNSSNPRGTARGYYKFRDVLSYIDRDYVDTVNAEALSEYAIQRMLEKLDPHSVYIPAREMDLANSYLEGDFDGVGVEFNIYNDTISVVAPLAGGPAESVGIQTGDQILRIDGDAVAGADVTNEQVFAKLRGSKGSKVVLSVKRTGEQRVLDFTVTRARIPSTSVDVAYMVDNHTGYLKVSRFAKNTYKEFRDALGKLKRRGMQRLVLDLRGNPGGYMDQATQMADEFLAGQKKIVYTDGKGDKYDTEMLAHDPGIFEQGPLVVLLDEGSASAAEIVAGALQDNDRALIVGRRSFGKGLVQLPIPLPDGSELRLTISRYYTPSGRCIQKPYKNVAYDDYEDELVTRFRAGEEFRPDSNQVDRTHPYKTLVRGRTVYGGGGIMPDVFVARDTTELSDYLSALFAANIPREFALRYYQAHSRELRTMGWKEFQNHFQMTDKMLLGVVNEGVAAHVAYDRPGLHRAKGLLTTYIKSFIARSAYGSEEAAMMLQEKDDEFQAALRHFEQAGQLASGR